MLARRRRMLAAVLGTALLVAGIAPAAALAGSPASVPAAAIGSELAVQYARFYPRKDDYRDTNLISGTTLVPATVTIRIYTSGGTRIKSFLLGTIEGAYSVVWNGRKKDGSLFPQGTYTVKQFLTAEGTTETTTHTVVLSHKRVYWYLGSQTRYADTGAFFVTGGANVYHSTVFYRGMGLVGGNQFQEGGDAAARYVFTLPPAHVYASLRVSLYGQSNFGPGDHEAFGYGYIGIYNFDTETLDGTKDVKFDKAWYESSVPAAGHVTAERKVQTWARADADDDGYLIFQKMKLTYKYGNLDY
jgi:hypothetical protein